MNERLVNFLFFLLLFLSLSFIIIWRYFLLNNYMHVKVYIGLFKKTTCIK